LIAVDFLLSVDRITMPPGTAAQQGNPHCVQQTEERESTAVSPAARSSPPTAAA
jgi:hypothetical protein